MLYICILHQSYLIIAAGITHYHILWELESSLHLIRRELDSFNVPGDGSPRASIYKILWIACQPDTSLYQTIWLTCYVVSSSWYIPPEGATQHISLREAVRHEQRSTTIGVLCASRSTTTNDRRIQKKTIEHSLKNYNAVSKTTQGCVRVFGGGGGGGAAGLGPS